MSECGFGLRLDVVVLGGLDADGCGLDVEIGDAFEASGGEREALDEFDFGVGFGFVFDGELVEEGVDAEL